MSPKIFATGTTGYIGGDVLYVLLQKHPDWASSTTCLVRDSNRGASLAAVYPSLRLVYGSLDDVTILETEAANADIVLHFASSDLVGAVEAIARGLQRSGAGCWIHTSGTDIFMLQAGEDQGQVKRFDDWEGVEECTSRPDNAPHRPVDQVVLSTHSTSSPNVKTAIVTPSLVYGPGRGPANKRSHQAYELARIVLQRGGGFTIGKEDYMWFSIHVYDLSRLYLTLVEAAVRGDDGKTWEDKAYYVVENGEFRWNELVKGLAGEAYKKGLIESQELDTLEGKEREELGVVGVAVWNVWSRVKALRARKVLGWTPKERGLMEEVPDIVKSEAERARIGSQ